MSTLPTTITHPVADLQGLPLPSLIATAQLLGGSKPYVTANNENIVNPVSLGATSSGAQSTGPGAPTVVVRATGGALTAGTYATRWTFFDGAESLPGVVTTVTTTGSTSSLVHTIPTFPTGAIRAFVYRQKDASGHYYRVGQVDDLTRTVFIDTLVESAITSNPEPATSAPAVGTLTFSLMAPTDLSDLANLSAVFQYRITIGTRVYYTTAFAYSASPITLASILGSSSTPGITTRINWKLIDPDRGPQIGIVSSFSINRTCSTLDTGEQILAQVPKTNADDGGSDSQGRGHIDLVPQDETTNPGGWYIGLLQAGDIPEAFICPMPDSMGHPDGFEWDELTRVSLALPGQQIASMANIQAVLTELDSPQTSPLTTANSGETELVNIRNILGADKGTAATHWKDARVTLDTTGNATIGGDAHVVGNTNLDGYLSVNGALGIGTVGQLYGEFLQLFGLPGTDGNPAGVSGHLRFVGRHDGGHPTANPFAAGDAVLDFTTPTIWLCTTSGTPGTWIQLTTSGVFAGEVQATDFKATGIAGAATAGRWVGRHDGGAPTTNPFLLGDWVTDFTTPAFWLCIASGTPGTWVQLGGTGGALVVSTITTNTTASSAVDVYRINATSGDVALTLPTCATWSKSRPLIVLRTDNSVHDARISTTGGQTINGTTALIFTNQFQAAALVTDATVWNNTIAPPIMSPSGSLHASGLVPDPGSSAGTAKVLHEDATWGLVAAASISAVNPSTLTGSGTVPVAKLPVLVASGSSHAAGVAPDPGVTAGSTKFLREDATWAVPAGGGGGASFSFVTKTANYTITTSDSGIAVDASSGDVTITLPTAVGSIAPYPIVRVDSSVHLVSIVTTGGQTINGLSTWALVTQYQVYAVMSNNTNWLIEGGYYPSPLTTAGDLLVAGASGIPTRFPKGTDAYIFRMDPSTHLPVWANPTVLPQYAPVTNGDTTTPLILFDSAANVIMARIS